MKLIAVFKQEGLNAEELVTVHDDFDGKGIERANDTCEFHLYQGPNTYWRIASFESGAKIPVEQ